MISTVFMVLDICEMCVVLQHLLFSVTDPQYRVKPTGVSDVSSFGYRFLPNFLDFHMLICLFSFSTSLRSFPNIGE